MSRVPRVDLTVVPPQIWTTKDPLKSIRFGNYSMVFLNWHKSPISGTVHLVCLVRKTPSFRVTWNLHPDPRIKGWVVGGGFGVLGIPLLCLVLPGHVSTPQWQTSNISLEVEVVPETLGNVLDEGGRRLLLVPRTSSLLWHSCLFDRHPTNLPTSNVEVVGEDTSFLT